MTMKEEIGKKLKQCRLEKNLTQKEVASKLFISQQYYSSIENGTYELSYEMISIICKLFDISADYLFNLKKF